MLRDSSLILPLLAFLLVVFAGPILLFMLRAVDNAIVPESLPRTVAALADWQPPATCRPRRPSRRWRTICATSRRTGNLAVLARQLNATREGFRSLMLKTANKLPEAPQRSWQQTLIADRQEMGAIRPIGRR